jgi:hypothetical protein
MSAGQSSMGMGPYIADNGDVISTALVPTVTAHASKSAFQEVRIVRGQILQVYTVDDPLNNPPGSGQYTLYDVAALRMDGSTETLRGVRLGQPGWGGGIFDFLEVNHGDMGPAARNYKVNSSTKPGNFVWVGFVEGQKNSAAILCAAPHSSPLAVAARPKKSEGKQIKGQFQGLSFGIAADGSFTYTFNGPLDANGNPTTQNGPTTVQIDGSGRVNISNNASQSIVMDRVAKKVTVINGTTSILMDNSGSGRIDVTAPVVQVGATENLEPMMVGNSWVTLMRNLIDAINQLTVPTGVGPSGTPINAAQFKEIADQLQSCLSTKHVVEK